VIQVLVVGVVVIYLFQRLTRALHRRGWIRWKMRRGSSSALGNAVLTVQTIYQPQIREVLEMRAEKPDRDSESGDPPSTGTRRSADAEQRLPKER
jgi:hypothetical protein